MPSFLFRMFYYLMYTALLKSILMNAKTFWSNFVPSKFTKSPVSKACNATINLFSSFIVFVFFQHHTQLCWSLSHISCITIIIVDLIDNILLFLFWKSTLTSINVDLMVSLSRKCTLILCLFRILLIHSDVSLRYRMTIAFFQSHGKHCNLVFRSFLIIFLKSSLSYLLTHWIRPVGLPSLLLLL